MAHTNGSEPINFRAALAAFESNTVTSSSSSSSSSSPSGAVLRSPKPRPASHAQTPARSSSDTSDPVPRSCSTPRIRKTSENGLLSAPSNNPFTPNTSASGMLNSPIPASVSPRFAPTTLKKSGSAFSLKELADPSLPPKGGSVSPSPLVRSRSRSVAEQHRDAEVGSSGRVCPQDLFADESGNQTESPAETANELDTSADDAMFAHAVMDPSSPSSSPASSLVPPQVPSRKGSESSTHSTLSNTPKLPPRPAAGGSLAPSPTISEFGQFPSATTPRGKKGVGYATYTPGVKRIAAAANGGGGGGGGGGGEGREGGMTPPALPPRSATLGGERARLGAPEPYRTRQKSPSKPSAPIVPRKPISAGGAGASRPAPLPRPTKPAGVTTWRGSTGGFKFGSSSSSYSTTANDASSAPPPLTRHLRGNSSSTTAHRKTGSNVFTSISLSDDASSELKRTLESDLDSDHIQSQQRLPPRRQPPPLSSSSTFRSPATSQSGVVGVASSLIGTAASALPLFKPASGSAGGGKLADGAPSKQFGGVGISRSASTHSELTIRPADGQAELWSSAGRVQLADTTVARLRSVVKEPKNDGDRQRYEALFTKLVNRQSSAHSRQGQGENSNATIRAGWFESDPSPSLSSNTTPPTSETTVLSPRTVRKVWNKSKLSPSFLALVYDQLSPSTAQNGLHKQEFVKGMASIDAELERRKFKRERKREVRAKRAGIGRRVPPPPPV